MTDTQVCVIDIPGLVSDALDAGIHDPGLVVDWIDDRVPDEDLRAAFRQVMRRVVAWQMSARRRAGPDPTSAPPATDDTGAKPEQHTGAGLPPWSRWNGASAAYQRWLDSDLFVPSQGHKRWGDCTVSDIDEAIAARERHIADVQAQADQLGRTRDLMARLGCATVADVPPDEMTAVR